MSKNKNEQSITEQNVATTNASVSGSDEAKVVTKKSQTIVSDDEEKDDTGENNKEPDSSSDETKVIDEKQQKSPSDENKHIESSGKDELLHQEAQRLLTLHNVKRIWRCPKRGYWFINKERANDYEKSTKIPLTEYQPELKSEDEDGK
jgi:rubrerythrin